MSKFVGIAAVVAALLPRASLARADTALPHGVAGVSSAVFIALFAAQGFEVAPVPAGETRSPQRSVPIAVVSSLLAASVLYVIVQSVLVLSFDGLGAQSETPLVAAATSIAPGFGRLVAALGLVSTLGFVAGSALGSPRYLYAAAADRQLPEPLAAVHPRYQSPHRAVAATAAVVVAFLPFDYRSLVGMSNVAVAVQYLSTCLAVLRLRKLGERPSFRIPGGPVVPLLGAAMSLWIFRQASREELAWAVASLAAGLAARALSRRAA